MNKFYHTLFLYCFISVLIFLVSCESKNEKNTISLTNKTKDVSDAKVNLPYAEGEELFTARCITCHSLRYIQMQPDFPEKTWQKIVDKMVKSFGAPISDSDSKAIVEYLVAIKGKKE